MIRFALLLLFASFDYAGMAALHRSMKRIWEGKNMAGLLTRCEARAELCEQAAAESGRG